MSSPVITAILDAARSGDSDTLLREMMRVSRDLGACFVDILEGCEEKGTENNILHLAAECGRTGAHPLSARGRRG